jgi:hypothetical protein
MEPSRPLRNALASAVDLILASQNHEGGWRYSPVPADADVSVTVCQVMALRAAWNAGVGDRGTEEASLKAIAYIRRCANGNGSYSYMQGMGGWGEEGASGVPRAGAGAMSLISTGVTDAADRHLGPSLAFLRRHAASHLRSGHYLWYGQYYAAQALFHSPDPADWERYWAVASANLLQRQTVDGTWPSGEGPSPAYGTGMALIILQIPNQYLPILQR